VYGYRGSSIKALSLWESVYSLEKASNLYISLTDTFSTEVFFREFRQDPEVIKRWSLRQDSGDPLEYIKKAQALYESLGIDVNGRLIVFSDSLNIDKAIKIKKACDAAGIRRA
jgi:nicotinate phosphoribosyltransferase